MAKALKDSEFTSIQERIEKKDTWRTSFGKGDYDLPYYISSYIDLVDETGRCIRDDKRGFIARDSAKALDLVGLDAEVWLDELKGFKSVGYSAVGTTQQLKGYTAKTSKNRTVGLHLKSLLE